MPFACVEPKFDGRPKTGCVSCHKWVHGQSCWIKTYHPGTAKAKWNRMCEVCFWCKVVTDELWNEGHTKEGFEQAAQKMREVCDVLASNRAQSSVRLKIVDKTQYQAYKSDPFA